MHAAPMSLNDIASYISGTPSVFALLRQLCRKYVCVSEESATSIFKSSTLNTEASGSIDI
jgi:hypothetical protein